MNADRRWCNSGPPSDWPNAEASLQVRCAGLDWHVQQAGSGPQLLLIHGTASATHSWRDLLPIMAQDFAVTAMDLPGHGFTSKPAISRLSLPDMAVALSELVDQIGRPPDIVCGHSAGAAIAAQMCLEGRISPHLVVSLNGALQPYQGNANPFYATIARLMALNPVIPFWTSLRARRGDMVEQLLKSTGSRIDQAGVRAYRQVVSKPRHVSAALGMMSRWNLQPLLERLHLLQPKLLLIVGGRDRAVPPSVSREIARRLTDAKVVELTDLGHLAHEEAPEQVAGLILDAWRGSRPN